MRKIAALLAGLLLTQPAFAAYYPTPVTVNAGGTGATTLTAHGVLLGEGTSAVVAVTPVADAAIVYTGGASADPTAIAVGNCANALTYSTSTHTFGCANPTQHAIVIGGASGAAFSTLANVADSVVVFGATATDPTTAGTSATADSVLGWAAAGTTPAPLALLSCSSGSSALTYNTGTHVFGCNSITGSGSVAVNVLTAAGPFTLSSTYDTVNISRMGTPAAATYNLPSAVTAGNGFRGCLKDDTTNFATNTASIKSPTAGNIDGTTGSTGITFTVQRGQICYVSDGSNWFLN